MKKIRSFINKGSERTARIKKNILITILTKGVSIVTGLLLVPLTINYVNPNQYGIWLTLSSIVGWLSFFDIGFGNGFRNKFSIARATGDDTLARIYVSTIYTYLGIIFFIVWTIFILLNSLINWSYILNFDPILENEVSNVAIIIFTYFCLQFVLRIISTIITADQKPAKASFIDTMCQVLSLLVIFALTKVSSGSLLKLAISLSIAPLFVLIFANIWFFKNSYKTYRPSFRLANLKHAKEILNLGGLFFFVQIAAIIQYQTTNFLISHYFGPTDVTSYNIAFKYFSVLNMLFSILILPFWSAVTEAYIKHDTLWIKNAVKNYLRLWTLFVIGGIIMLVFASDVYNIWLGHGKITVPFSISLWTAIFTITSLFSGIFVSVINGIGAIRIQFYMCFITPLLFILMSYILITVFSFGVESILISSIISNITGIIIIPIQYTQIMKGKSGVWLR